jgi:hypothetical protein
VIELTKVDRENKVYVNDNAIIIDKEAITPSELLELSGFSSLVYDCYLEQNRDEEKGDKKKKGKENRPLKENKKINIQTGMHFNAILKQQQQ